MSYYGQQQPPVGVPPPQAWPPFAAAACWRPASEFFAMHNFLAACA
uniref:Uncharacterized protein n=1 Tax=Setaria italica TaxID=4555 RepID=K4AP13_SETIT